MNRDEDFDVQGFLPYLLNQAAEAASLDFQKVYKARFGMLRTEWRVLFHLGHFGSMTAREICDRARLHKTKVSRAVRKLADRRYLTRRRDAKDRRSEHLALTPLGERVYRDLNAVAAEYDRRLLADFSSAEAQMLRGALRKLGGLG